MTPRPTIVPKLLLGVLVAACLPRFPEGERGVQCWTDRAVDRSSCYRTALWCLDGAEDAPEAEACISMLERCEAASVALAVQCERRTGCIAAQEACEDACTSELSQACFDECRVDFELCAPWSELDCERECQEPLGECLSTATHLFHEAACDREHLDCVLECYDRSPDEGAEQGTCDPGRYTCDDERITACVDGNAVRGYSCDEVCQALGSESLGCRDDDCECLGQSSPGTLCEQAVAVVCTCSVEIDGVACSPDDTAQLVQQCEDGSGSLVFECYADFIDDVPEACELLFFGGACECPWANDGECDEPEGTGVCPEGTDPGDC
jgi:hypothetical protein